jgi:thymidine phosphorylase
VELYPSVKILIALAGLFATFDIGTAKLSGRGLGHTGGTIDKFEAISGFHFPQTKEEMIKQLELEINHYAKRQMVWFKRNKKIEWV